MLGVKQKNWELGFVSFLGLKKNFSRNLLFGGTCAAHNQASIINYALNLGTLQCLCYPSILERLFLPEYQSYFQLRSFRENLITNLRCCAKCSINTSSTDRILKFDGIAINLKLTRNFRLITPKYFFPVNIDHPVY